MDKVISQEQVEHAVRRRGWILGAVNYDEDLHFSSYYLRASLPRETRDLYPGYSCILSFYRDFTERYYLLEEECRRNARAIVLKAEKTVGWLQKVLEEITDHCQRLWNLFDESEDPGQFRELSDEDLLSVYMRHHELHTVLYRWARLPEALDRGVSYFTDYLVGIIREAAGPTNDWRALFDTITQPVRPSVLSESLDGLTEIARRIAEAPHLRDRLLDSPKRARIALPADLLELCQRYHDRWKYLNYHGYGERDLGSVSRTVERAVHALAVKPAVWEGPLIQQRLEARRDERDKALDGLHLAPEQRQLFELYPEIGSVKLLRRYVQLRNFFYLDLLVQEFARRLHTSEWQIRFLLPEEIVTSFKGGSVAPHFADRCNGCLYCELDGKTAVLTGGKLPELLRCIESNTMGSRDRKVLKGVVACRGKVTGTCKVVIRPDAHSREAFRQGQVLVSESTDPDLLNLLKIAGAVLTEQGGVTSHAALICRELGVPAIVGIPGLLELVADGDTVEVDADSGVIQIAKAAEDTPALIIPFADAHRDRIGGKAHGLLQLLAIGCRIPEFVLLDTSATRDLVQRHDTVTAERLITWLKSRFRLENDERLAVRSSSTDEDGETCSSAGRFESFLNVRAGDLLEVVGRFLRVNDDRGGGPYVGSVIVQRMLRPDYSGVCVTMDERLANGKQVVIEALPGDNTSITQGIGRPARFLVNRETGDVETSGALGFDLSKLRVDIPAVASLCCRIEAHFGRAVDVEWAVLGERLYILQARPVVFKRDEMGDRHFPRSK